MDVFQKAVLNTLDGIVKLLKMFADGILVGNLNNILAAGNLPDGRYHDGRSAGGDFGEFADLLVRNGTALDLLAEIGGALLERHVSDGRENRVAVGSNVRSVPCDADEVRC